MYSLFFVNGTSIKLKTIKGDCITLKCSYHKTQRAAVEVFLECHYWIEDCDGKNIVYIAVRASVAIEHWGWGQCNWGTEF